MGPGILRKPHEHRRLVADVLVHADLFLTPVRGSARSLQVAINAIVGQRDQTVHDGLRVGVYGDNVARESRAGRRIERVELRVKGPDIDRSA